VGAKAEAKAGARKSKEISCSHFYKPLRTLRNASFVAINSNNLTRIADGQKIYPSMTACLEVYDVDLVLVLSKIHADSPVKVNKASTM
jgi:hypothetical protein